MYKFNHENLVLIIKLITGWEIYLNKLAIISCMSDPFNRYNIKLTKYYKLDSWNNRFTVKCLETLLVQEF